MGILLLVAFGAAAYYAVHLRRRTEVYGSLAGRVSELRMQLTQLRDAQWKMRTAIDSLREEQDFTNQLRNRSEPGA